MVLLIKYGAGTRSRTKDFHITNVALYQLSYTGVFSRREYSARLRSRPAVTGYFSAFVADADQYFDAFLLRSLGQRRQAHDADLVFFDIAQFARIHMVKMMMGMGG